MDYYDLAAHPGHSLTVKMYASRKDHDNPEEIPGRAVLFCNECGVEVASYPYQSPCKRLQDDDDCIVVAEGKVIVPKHVREIYGDGVLKALHGGSVEIVNREDVDET